MRDYDDWKLDSGQDGEVVVGSCDGCDGEIYEGEDIFHIKSNDDIVHISCLGEYAKAALDAVYDIAVKKEE